MNNAPELGKLAALEDVKAYFAKMDAARQMTANEAAPMIADKDLIKERVDESFKQGLGGGLLLGLLGAALGAPLGIPEIGAAMGLGYGVPAGVIKGQADANKKFLAAKGVDAKLPNILPYAVLRPELAYGLTTVAPGSGHLNLTKSAEMNNFYETYLNELEKVAQEPGGALTEVTKSDKVRAREAGGRLGGQAAETATRAVRAGRAFAGSGDTVVHRAAQAVLGKNKKTLRGRIPLIGKALEKRKALKSARKMGTRAGGLAVDAAELHRRYSQG